MSEQAVFEALKYHIEVDYLGSRMYYNSANQLHRTDGPAIEYFNGDRVWYQNDQLHRTDGPAVEYSNGDRVWFINDEQLSEAEFNQAVKNVRSRRF